MFESKSNKKPDSTAFKSDYIKQASKNKSNQKKTFSILPKFNFLGKKEKLKMLQIFLDFFIIRNCLNCSVRNISSRILKNVV